MNDTSKPMPPDDSSAPLTGSALVDAKLSDEPATFIMTPLHWLYAALAVLAVLLLVQWWNSTNQINQLREELARRLQTADVGNTETKAIAKSMFDMSKELQVKLGVLENKQSESENHAVALEQLYQDLSKTRDEWALTEIEQVLSTASQQLQLAGNVHGALIALQNADARLARSDKPQFITVRRAIGHDIDRLKALPNLDLPGIALRLDSAITQIESMPLLMDERSVQPVSPAGSIQSIPKVDKKALAATDAKETQETGMTHFADWKNWLGQHWRNWTGGIWNQVQQLIRIRNVENPDALLLAPDQGYFVKENVKLRLLNARLALLSRSEMLFKSDIAAAQKEILLYFDTRAKQTQAVQALLRQIQNSNVSIEMPNLGESLNAVRNFTVKQ